MECSLQIIKDIFRDLRASTRNNVASNAVTAVFVYENSSPYGQENVKSRRS
jgi:hypothetical protein